VRGRDASFGRENACSWPRTRAHDRPLKGPSLLVKGERVDNDGRILPFNGEMIMSGYEFLDRAVITFAPLPKLTSDRFFPFFRLGACVFAPRCLNIVEIGSCSTLCLCIIKRPQSSSTFMLRNLLLTMLCTVCTRRKRSTENRIKE